LPAIAALESLPLGQPLFHDDQELRHPLSTYSVSSSQLVARFHRLLDIVEEVQVPEGRDLLTTDRQEDLCERIDALLDASFEHIDACEKSLPNAFVSPNAIKHPQPYRSLRKKLKDLRRQIATAVNHLKHRHCRIRLVIQSDPSTFIIGYYIEDIVEPNVLGPSRSIHPGGDTAFSINRDLRLHFCQLLIVSQIVADFVSAMSGQSPSPQLTTCKRKEKSSRGLVGLATRIASLPDTVFPDEQMYGWPNLASITTDANNSVHLSIEYPSSRFGPNVIHEGVRMTAMLKTDPATSGYQVPYLGTHPSWIEKLQQGELPPHARRHSDWVAFLRDPRRR